MNSLIENTHNGSIMGSSRTVMYMLIGGYEKSAYTYSSVFSLFCSYFATELIIPATGNVFYAMTSSSVDFLLRRKGGKTLLGPQPISTETSATFPRIKAKGRRLVRTLF